MYLSQITLLSLQWFESVETGSYESLATARDRLIEYLVSVGNTPEQVDYWMGYSVVMKAFEEETIESVMKTEVIIARMQGQIV